MAELPFDKVEIKTNGAWTPIALEQWLKVDCTQRVDQIIHGQVQFSMKGARVPATTALAAVNAARKS